jgi:hypothetical protein
MSDSHEPRWSDERLEQFYQNFIAHVDDEVKERKQQQEMYDALFRQEDPSRNVAPGVIQLMVQTATRVEKLCIAADRQKTFIGGALAAVGAIWFVVIDAGPSALAWLKKVLS